MNNETTISLRFKNYVNGQKKLEEYVKYLKQANTLLNSMDKNKINDITRNIKASTDKLKEQRKEVEDSNKKKDLLFDTAKITTFIHTINRLARTMSSYTNKSATFLENVNLLDVAFKNNTTEANKFIGTLSEMYGLDESWATKTVGIFKQLANAMGLADEVGTRMSKTLTQLAIDTSSLYNIDVEDTVSILQSALAGQTKPSRRLGADITQSTLQLTIDSAGIDRTIESLSYAEKRLVIVASLLNQTQQSFGDWGRTIESVANQMRIYQQQTERLTRALGNVFLPVLKEILPYINAFLMSLVEIVNWLAVLVGYDPKEFDYFSGLDDSVIDFTEDLASANEEAKKLRSGLRGFDELNVITTPTSAGGGGVGAIDPKILELFNKSSEDYLNSLDEVSMKATKIRDQIMQWLGFTKKIDPITKDISFEFEKITGGTILGTLAVGGIIYSGINKIFKILSALKLTKFTSLGNVIGTITKNINNLFTTLKNGTFLKTLTTEFAPLLTKIKTFITSGQLLKTSKVLAGIALTLDGTKGVYQATKKVTLATKDYKEENRKLALRTGEVVAGTALIGSAFGPVGTAVGALAGSIIALTTNLISYNQVITSIAKDKLFGSLNIDATQWLAIIKNTSTQLPTYAESFAVFQNQMASLDETFKNNLGSLELFGYRYGKIGGQISETDAPKIMTAIEEMCNSTNQMIDESTNLFVKVWGASFSKMSVLTDEEEKDILKSVIDYSTKQKKELKNAQDNITSTYQNAIATRGYLTDEEYNYINTQLQKIRELTQSEMSKSYTDALYLQETWKNDSNKLSEESYAEFNQALRTYNEEQNKIISDNYNVQRNIANAWYEQHKNEGQSALDKYNAMIETANQERIQSEETLRVEINNIQQGVYEDLADKYALIQNKTDETSKEMRSIIENVFKGINFDASEIINEFSSIGNEAGRSCAVNVADAFNKKGVKFEFELPDIQGEVAKNGKFSAPVTAVYQRPFGYADGGLPPVGQLFVANEKGPELVGHIGGQSFVANQNQILDLIGSKATGQSVNATFVIQVGNKEIARQVISDIQDIAKDNGKPITIGGY